MNFYWNSDSLVNLSIDFFFLLGYAFTFYFCKKEVFRNKYIKNHYILALTYFVIAIFIFSQFFPISSFFFIRFCWQIITVGFPIAIFLYILKFKRTFLILPLFVLIFTKIYAEVIEPNKLEIQNLIFKTDKVKSNFRIVHLSDLHYESSNQTFDVLIQEIINFNPHTIFITGDFLNDFQMKEKLFEKLKLIQNTTFFLVDGDHDSNLKFDVISNENGFHFLHNQSEYLSINGNDLTISGIENKLYKDQSNIDNLTSSVNARNLNLLLSHRPDVLYLKNIDKFDIVFSGHTHGGQVNIPWLGPISTVSKIPNYIAMGGLFPFNGTTLISNRGIGMEGNFAPRIRMFCKPHAIFLTISSSKE